MYPERLALCPEWRAAQNIKCQDLSWIPFATQKSVTMLTLTLLLSFPKTVIPSVKL